MTSNAPTVEAYLQQLPSAQQAAVEQLRQTILQHLPEGFEEIMNYGMIGYVVPHHLYPAGYHCDPKLPLPFMALAAQKNSINFYHMGMYSSPALLEWFTTAFARSSPRKPDMGKSCIRFKKQADIPFELIGALVQKMSVKAWIELYEQAYRHRGKKKGQS